MSAYSNRGLMKVFLGAGRLTRPRSDLHAQAERGIALFQRVRLLRLGLFGHTLDLHTLGQGQVDRERAAGAVLALDGDPASVCLYYVLDYREAQAAPLHVVHEARAYAVELLEYLLLVCLRDAHAFVRDRYGYLAVLLTEPHEYLLAGAGILDGVIHEINEGLSQRLRVDDRLRQGPRRALAGYGEVVLLQADFEHLERFGDHFVDVGFFELVLLLRRLDLGEVEDVVYELRQPATLCLDVLAILPDLFGLFDAAEGEKLSEDPDGRERNAEF